MGRAIPGTTYVVAVGDTLWDIAASAYGDPRRYRDIWTVNQSTLRSDDPHWIYPGEILWIPPDANLADIKFDTFGADILTDKSALDFTLVIDGVEVPVERASAFKSIETCSNAWSARVRWDPNDPELKRILKPYLYPEAKVFVGGVLVVSGILYKNRKTISTTQGSTALLEGNNATADIIDSNVRPPYQRNNKNLLQLAEDMVKPFGIPIVVENADGVNDPFKRVKANRSDKIFDFLHKLAKQRSVLISSNEAGDMVFTTAKKSTPVGVIEEDAYPWIGGDMETDGRKRFSVYKAVGTGPRARKKFAIANDENISRSRFRTVETDDTTTGDIQKAADWARSKQLADALTFDLPVISWYAPNDALWREGTMVTVKSPSLDISEGFDFLIKSVKYNIDSDSGATTDLSLVPIQVYTGEPLEEPWS